MMQGSATSAVILRFELLYSPIIESIDAFHAAAHDFRVPPKALSGLHSYCPVHFDTLHAVLIDVSVHVSVMKSAAYKRPAVLSRYATYNWILHHQPLLSSTFAEFHASLQLIWEYVLCSDASNGKNLASGSVQSSKKVCALSLSSHHGQTLPLIQQINLLLYAHQTKLLSALCFVVNASSFFP